MRLSCPSCGTTFAIPASTKPGQKARCARCKTVFKVPERELTEEPEQEKKQKESEKAKERPPKSERTEARGLSVDAVGPVSGTKAQRKEPRAGGDGVGWGEPDLAALEAEADAGPEPTPSAGAEGERASPTEADAPAEFEPAAGSAPTPETASDAGDPLESPKRQQPIFGRSAIRAQSGVEASLDSAAAAQGNAGAVGADTAGRGRGWHLRFEDGSLEDFKNLNEVHVWLEGNPGVEVEISQDGLRWQTPAALRSAQAAIPLPEPTGLSVALRSAVITGSQNVTSAAAGLWGLLAFLSTLLLLALSVVTLQTYGIVSLDAWVPFQAFGLGAIAPARRADPPAPSPGTAPKGPAQLAHEQYEALMEKAQTLHDQKRWIDATVAYRRALSLVESPEALEGLASLYESLGEGSRAKKVRGRLDALRASREGRKPEAGP